MNFFKRLFSNKSDADLVKVYSHPRSGTHFMEAFIAQNFYTNKNLKVAPVYWGHWSNREIKKEGNPYGKLFGHHYATKMNQKTHARIYMRRNCKAVAYSVWKTPNFLNPELQGISFSDFLRTKIDWYGSPSHQAEPKQNIVEHWIQHVNSWQSLADVNPNVLIINYEDLVDNPYDQYKKIHHKFFKQQKLLTISELKTITAPVGLLPNKAIKDSWKDVFSDEDNVFFNSIVNQDIKNSDSN